MNIKFNYCICIKTYEKAHYILQKYHFGGGQKFMHVSYNEWSLEKFFCKLVEKESYFDTSKIV